MFAPSTVAFVSLRLSLDPGFLVPGGVVDPGAHERPSPRLSIGDLSIIWAEARAPLAKRDPFSSTYHSNIYSDTIQPPEEGVLFGYSRLRCA